MAETARFRYPFEADIEDLKLNLDKYVAVTVNSLQSYYLVMPRGSGFVEYQDFERAYRVLFRKTNEFSNLTVKAVLEAVEKDPLVFVVLRCMLGFSPPELAHLAATASGIRITQAFARTLDQRARNRERLIPKADSTSRARVEAILRVACQTLAEGLPHTPLKVLHRLAKVDTECGILTVRRAAKRGVPYAMLLYERFLGRPFASHRDAVSESVGEILEGEVKRQLVQNGIPFYQPVRAERLPGIDQTPDFLIPSRESPRAVIEAKLAEDDGTARDKVTRVHRLREISDLGLGFAVIACIDGRGFSIRREDIKRLLMDTNGKVFTMATIGRLVEATILRQMCRS